VENNQTEGPQTMILSDVEIADRIKTKSLVISPPPEPYCLQPASLDVRLGTDFRIYPKQQLGLHIEPATSHFKSDEFELAPGQFVLGTTKESIRMPNDLAADLSGRSSLGRMGLLVHATAGYVDPGFSGTITLELKNINDNCPIMLRADMRIGQLVFFLLTSPCANPYGSAKLRSKYQDNSGTFPYRAEIDKKL
jgi:dCTP deaminase